MTSTASSNAVSAEKQRTVNAFRHNFFEQLKDSKKMMIIVFIMHFFAAPVCFLSAIYNCATKTDVNPDDMFGVIGIFTTIIAAGCGIIIALNIFRYLYKRPVVDMSLSLPLSGNEKFFSDFLAGLTAYLAPFIAAEIMSYIILGIGQLAFGGKEIVISKYDTYYITICNTFSTSAFPLLELVIGGIVIMLMIYVMTLLVITCCGTLFESSAYTLMLNGLIPAVIVCGIALFFNDLYGIDFEDQFFEVLGVTSPAGGAYGLANAVTDSVSNRILSSTLYGTYDSETAGSITILPLLKWMLPMILITAAMFGLSYVLYRKRKAEQVTKPFVFRAFYNIIVTAAIFCILSLFMIEDEVGVPAFITAGIVFLIFEVVTNRGFKKLWKSAVKYVFIVAAVLGVNFISNATDGFGIVNKVPSAGSVSSVMVSTSYGTEIGYTFSETENIQKIIDIHKYCLESRNADYENGVYSFDITYKLRSGGNMTRQYGIPITEMNKYAEITATKEGHECRAEYVYNHLTDLWEHYVENKDRNNDSNLSNYDPGFCVYSGVNRQYSRDLWSATLPSDFGYRLAEALRDDILDETPEQYLRSEAKLCTLTDNYGLRIMILPHFTRTINYLTGCGVMLSDTTDLTSLRAYLTDFDFYIGAPDNEFTKQNGGVTSTYCYSGDIIYYNDSNGFLTADRKTKCDEEFLKKFDELIKVSSERYITTESCYTIVVGGTVYVVPPEYTKLADEVYKYCVSPSSLEDTEEYYD